MVKKKELDENAAATALREALLAGDEGVLPDGRTVIEARSEFMANEKAAAESGVLTELAELAEPVAELNADLTDTAD